MSTNRRGNDDPFRPPAKPVQVICIHCDDRYSSHEMRYERRDTSPDELWYCRNPGCDGAGFGFDILPDHELESEAQGVDESVEDP